MPRGLNKLLLIGNVGGAPEIKTLPSGSVVAEFSVATNQEWKDRDGQKQSKTEWHNCKAWDKLAGVVSEYVVKGMQVYVEGRLETRTWEADDGSKRSRTEVRVFELQMLSGREGGAEERNYEAEQVGAEQDDLPF
jgi:single-strand DNA-binding protein